MERWHHAFTKNDKGFKELFGVKRHLLRMNLVCAILNVAD